MIKYLSFLADVTLQLHVVSLKKHIHQYEEKSGAGRRKEALKKIETEEEERSKSDNDLAIEIARQLQGLIFFHCAFFLALLPDYFA